MPTGRPKRALEISEEERQQLESIAHSRSVAAGLNQRAKLVLACAGGISNSDVAVQFKVTRATVGKWRQRFIEGRIAGLYDELRPGAPRTISDERIAALDLPRFRGELVKPLSLVPPRAA